MEKYCLSDRFAALCFTHSRLDSREAARALHRALVSNSLKPWPEAEIELFSRRGSTLLIARPRSGSSDRQKATK